MTPQSSIAHYRITAKLGEGGNGGGLPRDGYEAESRGRDEGASGFLRSRSRPAGAVQAREVPRRLKPALHGAQGKSFSSTISSIKERPSSGPIVQIALRPSD